MKRVVVAFAMLLMAGCGVDGPPEPVESVAPGVTVSGTASFGLVGSF